MYFSGDEKLARILHERYNNASIVNSKKLVEKENVNIIDSRLEYQDPTPNIYDLFVLFDRKFFWGTLGRVEVKWSNRMTTCAGLCYYQGRRGLCSIKLSAPLLSLRPRKDLVETLLHEMIHAYLFVTENFSDREDHGPEFLKHMNRINKEAGTNVTVYHTYLDEVDYYKKHIWRCNGACQNWKPFYGFVKRAMNRAPGPHDLWWDKHKQKCGGTFIKMAEPEKVTKKKNKNEKDNNVMGTKDIRNFLSSKTSYNFPSAANNGTGSLESSNIRTLQDLKTSPTNRRYDSNCINSQTYIIKSKTPKKAIPHHQEKTITNSQKQQNIETFVDRRSPRQNENLGVAETVRNIWSKKYPPPNCSPKRPEITISPVPTKKREVTCPICTLSFAESMINEHIDDCLTMSSSKTLDETLPVGRETSTETGRTVTDRENLFCNEKKLERDTKEGESSYFKLVQCIVCSKALDQRDLNDHMESCLKCFFENENECQDEDDDVSISVPCPCCLKWVLEKNINKHIDECLTYIVLKNSLG